MCHEKKWLETEFTEIRNEKFLVIKAVYHFKMNIHQY